MKILEGLHQDPFVKILSSPTEICSVLGILGKMMR